jgi:hypothetical protein
MDKLYDPECERLAEHFLHDDGFGRNEHAVRVQSLAVEIQAAVEAWCDANAEADAGDDG